MAIELTDDGTFDTVLRCSDCGEEMRYNYANSTHESGDSEDIDNSYDTFVIWAIEDATADHECPQDPNAEPTEPAEDDITTSDHETFYQNGTPHAKRVLWFESRWKGHGEPTEHWYYSESGHSFGDILGDFDTCESAVRAYMDRTQFWPNVWFISDHGNAHLMDLTEGK